jgi:hypothetical protein
MPAEFASCDRVRVEPADGAPAAVDRVEVNRSRPRCYVIAGTTGETSVTGRRLDDRRQLIDETRGTST